MSPLEVTNVIGHTDGKQEPASNTDKLVDDHHRSTINHVARDENNNLIGDQGSNIVGNIKTGIINKKYPKHITVDEENNGSKLGFR